MYVGVNVYSVLDIECWAHTEKRIEGVQALQSGQYGLETNLMFVDYIDKDTVCSTHCSV